MTCPFCNASLPDENLFCEECGKALQAVVSAPACTCGASAESIGEDGYCTVCGRLARRPETDHVEVALSALCAGVSDRGHKHARNEDRFGLREIAGGYVLVVCDGVSSSTQSELASAAAVERMLECLGGGSTMEAAMGEAQAAVAGLPPSPAGSDPASTTLIAAVVKNATVTIGWAGDSRAYWITETEARPLMADHSWMNDVISSGEMTLAQASRSPNAHAITRWLGADAGPNFRPEVAQLELHGNGWLLLCTDGLWNYAQEPEQIWALVRGMGSDALPGARKLVEFANGRGGQDNVTAVLLRR